MKPRKLFFYAVGLGFFAFVVMATPRFIRGQIQNAEPKADDMPVTVTRKATASEIAAFRKAINDPATILREREATVAHWKTHDMEVSAIGGWLDVAMATEVFDRRPGYRYRWSFRVIDPETKMKLVNKNYDNQIFTIPQQQAQPRFAERIQLLPGIYQVEVVLHACPPGFDFTQLENDKNTDLLHRVASQNRTILVPPAID